MEQNKLKQRVYLIAEGYEDEILTLENRILELQGDAKALEAYTVQLEDEEREEKKRSFEVSNGVAILEIKGPLVARTTWMSRMMGAVSYEDLRGQFIEALSDGEVERILIDADTPGGQVNGLSELSTLIKTVGKIKPVDTYVAGGLLSAGYWLGSATDRIFASETSFVGSIGVVVTHTSYQGMLEKEGIKVTKIKSGDKKQVGSSEKDLSKEDKEYLQSQVNDLFSLFKRHVLTNRAQVNPDTFDGSEYLAEKALAMGLVDKVMAFDDVMAQLMNERESNGGTQNMAKKGLTVEQIAAAAASGAKLEDLELAGGDTASAVDPDVDVDADAEANADAEVSAEGETEADAKADDKGDDKGAPITVYLEAQLAKMTDKVSDLTVENREMKAKMEKLEGLLPELKTIVSEAINRMQVALGMSRIDLEGMEAEALIKQYKASSEAFNKAFKPGGLLNKTQSDEEKPKAKVTNIDQARMSAVGL